MKRRNSLVSGFPQKVCEDCDVPIGNESDLDKCNNCQIKQELLSGIEYLGSHVESARRAAMRRDTRSIRDALREAKNAIADLEKQL